MRSLSRPDAQWRAVLDRAQDVAKAGGRAHQEVLREFFYQQFLARIFYEADLPWVLKGGVALLARVQDARYSLDIDLLHAGGDAGKAVEELRDLVARDLGDGLVFAIAATEPRHGRQHLDQRRVPIEVYTGAKKRGGFHVDVVAGSLMTDAPEIVTARDSLGIPGLTPPVYRLYPTVDHIADKVCATEELTGGLPSSRARDLIDLVIFARTQTIDGNALIAAIAAERLHRGLPAATSLAIPAAWARTYPGLAVKTRHCGNLDFTGAQAVARDLVDPALDRSAAGQTWLPATTSWAL